MAKTTLEDISLQTGLSKTTISRILSGKAKAFRINSNTIEKVIKAAQSLNYKPEIINRLLHKKNMMTIGLAVPDLANPFFASLASSITLEAKKHDLTVMLFDTQEDELMEKNALNKMKEHHADGIIIVPCHKSPKTLEKIAEHIPVVQVDRYYENSSLPYVSTNNCKGAYEMMNLLLYNGHRNIICIQGPAFSTTNKERIKGCRKALEEFHEKCTFNVMGNEFSIQNGYSETNFALSCAERPTAVFALSNTIMLGAMKAIKEHGLKIPDDISLVSFDDNQYLDYLCTAITRVAQPAKNMGITAVEMILKSIISGERLNSNLLLKPTIIQRDSVRNITLRLD